ncbi:transcriptional regulator family: Fungal Specific TF [Aspergillus niger]|nr:transcriptional regulator family: Fungal Specific TF [Aspergillus niger]
MPNSGCHQDKSPMNCESCKRRHEKCDKSLPQWYAFPRSPVHGAESVNQCSRSCSKRSVSCKYTITAEIEEGPKYWRPIRPKLNYLPLNKLIDIITKLYESLEQRGMRDYTIWAQKLPLFYSMAGSDNLVMSSLLTLSASLLATIEPKVGIKQTYFYFRQTAVEQLRIASSKLCRENYDKVLAATMLLLWADSERSSWIALWTGLKSVFYSMPQEWRYESELAKFLETEQYLQTLDSSSIVSCQFNNKNLSGLADTITVLRHIQRQLVHIKKHYIQVNKLVDFLDKFLGDIGSLSPDQAFQRVHILRQWLFWLPPVMLRDGVDDNLGLAVLAQFFAVGLNLYCLFPELGCHDLGPLAVGPIKEIDRTVRARNMAKPHDPDVQLAMYLMGMPQSIATKYQDRLIADESAVGL